MNSTLIIIQMKRLKKSSQYFETTSNHQKIYGSRLFLLKTTLIITRRFLIRKIPMFIQQKMINMMKLNSLLKKLLKLKLRENKVWLENPFLKNQFNRKCQRIFKSTLSFNQFKKNQKKNTRSRFDKSLKRLNQPKRKLSRLTSKFELRSKQKTILIFNSLRLKKIEFLSEKILKTLRLSQTSWGIFRS